MSAPTPYNRLKDFTQYQLDHPSAPYSGSDHDAELNAVQQTLEQTVDNLNLIQRNDGLLKNQAVHPDALSTATKALISGWNPRGLWLTATAYAVKDVVEQAGVSYVCATAHTSGTFATDQAAGKWVILGASAGTSAATIGVSPVGGISSTNVQAALQELDTEKAKLAGSGAQTFAVADAAAANHAVSFGQLQKNLPWFVACAGTGDAMTGTLASGLTALYDGMEVSARAAGANATTTPTFNLTLGSTATGAKTIVAGDTGAALVAGDIAGTTHEMLLRYRASVDKWLLMNPLRRTPATAGTSDQRGLTCYLLPSATDGWRGLFRAGFWSWNLNQQWGGTFGGEMLDAATGTLRKVEFATGYIESDTTDSVGNIAANTHKAQGFKVSESLSPPAVWLKLATRGAGGVMNNLQVFIYSDDGTGKPSALITNGTATAQSGQRHAQDAAGGFWYRFVFATPPSLVAGTQYHIVAKSSGAVDATFYWAWMRQATNAKKYPHGNKCTGDGTPTWTASTAEALVFGVEHSSTSALLQSGGQFDAKLAFGEGSPLNQSRALCSQVRLGDLLEPSEHTGYIVGSAFTKDKTIVDIGYGEDHDRIVIRANATTGYASIAVYSGDFPAVAPTVITSGIDISSGSHSVGWYVRHKGDGADRVDLYVDGNTYSTTGLSKTFSDEFRQQGAMWVGGGFAIAPTWSGSSINSFTALPSALGWTYGGAATEANVYSVSGGKLFQHYGGPSALQDAYYLKSALGLVNATGSALTTKMRVNYTTNTKATDCPTVGLWDGTKVSRFFPKDYYVEASDLSVPTYPQVDNKGAEATFLHTIKSSEGFIFRNRKLLVDETNILGASATNQINFGDTTTTSGENADALWSYMKYLTTGAMLPQFTSGSISEFAVWSGDRKALWPSLYSSGAFVSVKSFCGLPDNYVRREWPQQIRSEVTSQPITASTSNSILTDMECFVVGEEVRSRLTAISFNNTDQSNTSMNLFLDGVQQGATAGWDDAATAVSGANSYISSNADIASRVPFGMHKVDVRWRIGGVSQATNRRRHINVEGKA